MQDLLQRCGNRKLLFDNKTKDLDKLEAQTAALLAVVDDVLAANEGKPYSNDLFREAQVPAAATTVSRAVSQNAVAAVIQTLSVAVSRVQINLSCMVNP